jgi:hypothetical protein
MIIAKPAMTADAARFYTALFSALTIVGVIVGGAYSIFQYFDARDRENRTYELQVAAAQLEARKPFFSKHLDLCSEASNAASTITTTNDPKNRQAAIENFWRLWDGPLAIVEDNRVAFAMIEFGECLKKRECKSRLAVLSIQLSHSCRQEISDHFDLHLPQLPDKPNAEKRPNP